MKRELPSGAGVLFIGPVIGLLLWIGVLLAVLRGCK